MKIIQKIKYKFKDIIALSVALPILLIIIGSTLAIFLLPIIFVIWLIKNLF
jgi:hypothetical protein